MKSGSVTSKLAFHHKRTHHIKQFKSQTVVRLASQSKIRKTRSTRKTIRKFSTFLRKEGELVRRVAHPLIRNRVETFSVVIASRVCVISLTGICYTDSNTIYRSITTWKWIDTGLFEEERAAIWAHERLNSSKRSVLRNVPTEAENTWKIVERPSCHLGNI